MTAPARRWPAFTAASLLAATSVLWWTLMLTAGSGGPTLALRRAIGGAFHLLAFGLPLAFLTVLVMATARFGMRAWPIWLLAPVALSPALYAAHLAVGV